MPPRKVPATPPADDATMVIVKPDRRTPDQSDREVWHKLGKIEADHDHLKDRMVLVENSIVVLTKQGTDNAARLDAMNARLEGMEDLLKVLPRIETAFGKQEQEQAAQKIRDERRAKAMNAVLTKNSTNVALLGGIIITATLQRVGSLSPVFLIGAIVIVVAFFIYVSARTYSTIAKP